MNVTRTLLTDPEPQPTLGRTIRAARLGFHWCPEMERYVRVSDGPDDQVRVEVVRADGLPTSPASFEYRRWWETLKGERLTAMPSWLLRDIQALPVGCHLLPG